MPAWETVHHDGDVRIDVFTLFPEMVAGFAEQSLLGRAQAAGVLDVRAHDLRAQTTDVHRTVDDSPFGGGAGMVLMPEPVFAAVEAVDPPRPLLYLSPAGRRFDQARARELAALDGFSLLCGRYEGVDERVREHLVDDELSIGDYVLGGGEVAAMVVLEAVGRLVPGVMGNETSADDECFSRRPARVPALHPTGGAAGLGRAGGPAVRRSRAGRTVAPGPGPRPTVDRRPDLLEARAAACATTRRRCWPSSTSEPSTPILVSPTQTPLTVSAHGAIAMQPTDLVDQSSLRTDIPDFGPGDTLKVHVRVVEGAKERLQVFQGAVIARQGDGLRETFTVRKVSYGVGVERTFPVHAPMVAKIEVVTRGDVRRAKLYYLRDRVGKAAKIKEKRER